MVPFSRRHPLLLLAASFLLANNSLSPNNSCLFADAAQNDMSADYYCGLSWPHAAQHCTKPCPTGNDDECSDLGGGQQQQGGGGKYECFYFTGCKDKQPADDTSNGDDTPNGNGNDNNNGGTTEKEEEGFTSASSNNFCGKSWIHAMLGCSTSCPNGYECTDPSERCFAATNCDQPLEELISELLATLQGPDSLMDEEDQGIFGGTIGDFIAKIAEEEGIALDGIDLGEQTLVGRRELSKRARHRALLGHERYMNFELKNITQRMLPSGSSAIDVSMVVTGDYRPPPYLDLDVIAEDSINRNGAQVVKSLRDRGEKAGRDFFRRVEGIEATVLKEVTNRPSKAPVRSPTWSPVGPPTSFPSGMPSYSPTSMPSGAPSRAHNQVIMTGSRDDLMLGGATTSSYGYLFNIRTKPTSGVVLLNGFDFYTESTDDVTFEVWTRLGSFKDYKGTYDGWDLIASGTTTGRGIGRYTSIPEEMFTPVAIPGGGGETGTRAFYMTLDSIDLVYKLGDRGGLSDEKTQFETDDIEIWEGEGVLFYPFPDPQDKFYYRGPRQYLGAVYYDRLPCKPFSVFGPILDMPCPDAPTGNPTLPPPTSSPVPPPTLSPSKSPVIATPPPTDDPSPAPSPNPIVGQTPAPINPTEMPTFSPTMSVAPSGSPTTVEPTSSPVVPMRSYIVTTLRNVPQRSMTDRETEKFVEIMTLFLQRHTDSSMVLTGIEFWHQDVIVMDAKEGYVVPGTEEEDEEDGDENEDGEDGVSSDEEETEAASDEEQSPVIARGITGTGVFDDRHRNLGWKKKKPEPPVQVHAMDITLILKITFANLPLELLGNMASVAIEEHSQEFMDLLHEQKSFYSFFRDVDGVFSRTILGVTPSPSASPSTEAYYLARQAELEAELNGVDILTEDDARSTFGIFVGLGIGFLWCCLTGISVAYLMSARGDMEEQRDMENLLKAEKVGPLDGASDSGDKDVDEDSMTGVKTDAAGNVVVDPNSDKRALKKMSTQTTVPLGNGELDDSMGDVKALSSTDEDSDDPWDHTQNARLAPRARNELSKSTISNKSKGSNGSGIPRAVSGASLNKLDDQEEGNTSNNNSSRHAPRRKANSRHQSVIVTAQETKDMLASDAMRRGGGAGTEQAKHRMSANAKIMGKDAKRKSLTGSFNQSTPEFTSNATPSRGISREFSQSMVLTKTDISSLEKELDFESEVGSNPRPSGSDQVGGRKRGGQRAMAKSMVIGAGGSNNMANDLRRSSIGGRVATKSSLRKSSIKEGDEDLNLNISNHSRNDIAGMRRSTRNPDSSDNLAGLKRSARKGSRDDLRRSSTKAGGDERSTRRSSSKLDDDGDLNLPSLRRSSVKQGGDDLAGMRRSTRKPESSDNVAGLKRSTRKGSRDDLRRSSTKVAGDERSTRRSSSKHGDDEDLNLPNLRRSSIKRSSDDLAGMRRSTRKPDSSENLAGLKRSARKGSSDNLAGADSYRPRSTKRSGSGGLSSSTVLRKSSNLETLPESRPSRARDGDSSLRKSDNEIRKPSRRGRSGSMGKSMIV